MTLPFIERRYRKLDLSEYATRRNPERRRGSRAKKLIHSSSTGLPKTGLPLREV